MEIRFLKVSKSFAGWKSQIQALDSVSWRAPAGNILGLIGPNGSGKTTTLKLMLGCMPAESGEILLDNRPFDPRLESYRERLGYIPEQQQLDPRLRARDQIVHTALLRGYTSRQAAERANALLDQFSLGTHARERIAKLSKGIAQRVQIACGLVNDPDLLLVDEPFYGLDTMNTVLVREILRDRAARGKTTILCTHQMNEIERLCDHLVIMKSGRVLFHGSLGELTETAQTFHELAASAATSLSLEDIFTTILRAHHDELAKSH